MSAETLYEVEKDVPTTTISCDDSPDSSKIEPEGSFADYIRIFSYADSIDWALNTVALCCSVATGASLPLMTIVFGRFVKTFNDFGIGNLSPHEFRTRINSFTLWFLYLFVGKLALTYVYTLAITISATRTTKALRIDFLERTLRQEIAFFDTKSPGSVSVQVTTSANLVSHGIGEKLGIAISAIATFISAFTVALVVQWKLTLITMVIIPLLVISSGLTVWIDAKQEARLLAHYSGAASLAEEVFSSIHTVHAFWAYEKLSKRFDEFLEAAENEGKKKCLNLGVMYCIEYFCIFAGYALAFWQGIGMYNAGQIQDPGKVITVIFAVVMAATSINYIAPQLTVISKAASAASELFRIIDRSSHIDPLAKDGLRPLKVTGDIELRDIEFSYPSRPRAKVTKGLTLSIPANKTTALVGPSGCGKSTIIGLIERWYDPSAGSILLDGVPINQLNLHWLRTNIRSVQQLPTLFNGTVFQNVVNGLVGTEFLYARKEVQMVLVEEACMSAHAHEFIIQLPHGYDTEVGEHGTMLSGGQKQRIAIARSIVSNPKVLLLDEATSALDAQSEELVQNALNRISQNRTTIVVAHKLATVQNADNIAVMEDGIIVEQGSHEDLLDLKGVYSRMVAAHDLGEEDVAIPVSSELGFPEVINSPPNGKIPPGEVMINEPNELKQTMKYNLIKCLRIMIKEQKSLWLYFAVLLSACLIAGLTFPALGLIFAEAMEVFELQGDDQRRKGNHFSIMFFMVAVINLIVYFTIGWISNIVAQAATHSYRLEMFNRLLHQDVAFFSLPGNTSGALTSHLSAKPTALEELFGFNLIIIMVAVMNITGSCILALIYGWKLALVVIFGALPALIFSGFVRIHMETKLEEFVSDRFSQSAGLAGEAVAAIRTVSSLALERHIIAQYRRSLDSVVQKSIKDSVFTMLWFSLSQSTEFLAMALGFWYGGHLLSTQEYSNCQFYTVFIAIIFTGQAAAQVFSFTTSITNATGSANYIFWLRNQKSTIRENQTNISRGPTGNEQIELSDLRFTYPQRNSDVIRGIDLKINPGQFVAFVGPSGCGKSTLIALLERFYDPTSGQISISNTNLSNLSPHLYRSTVGLVQQEPILYQGSIRENIALGLESPATDEQILRACAQANILTFIESLPEGFSTLCGTQGLQFSGGQRQRITIARALIRKPNLLLLDEATSALDRESEKVVQEALEKAGQHITTIAVAHRLSTIKNADVIYVIENGRIVESGTHRKLLAQRGVYYKMCLAQSLN